MITVINEETAVNTNPYPGMSLAEACSAMELAVTEACNDFQMSILLNEHAHLYANGTELDYVDEAGSLNEKGQKIREDAANLIKWCSDKMMEAWDKFIEVATSMIENFKAALAKATITEKDFNLVKSHPEVFETPVELKVSYTIDPDFIRSGNYKDMMSKEKDGEVMDAVELFVENGESTIKIDKGTFELAYKMVFANDMLKKIREAKSEANKALKEKMSDVKRMKNDNFQEEIAGLKASMKANVKTTKTLIKVYHMYMNQKIAILRAVMNNEPAKSLIRGTRAPAKVAAGAKAAGAAVASSKAGVAVSGAAKSAGEGLKSAGSAVSGAAKNAADGVKAAGNKIADGAKGAVDNVKGAGEKVRKHFTRK